jgi:hypothetical protein
MRVAREEGWQVMTFDRLRRRLRLVGLALAVGGLGAGGGWVVARRPLPVARRPRRARPLLGR